MGRFAFPILVNGKPAYLRAAKDTPFGFVDTDVSLCAFWLHFVFHAVDGHQVKIASIRCNLHQWPFFRFRLFFTCSDNVDVHVFNCPSAIFCCALVLTVMGCAILARHDLLCTASKA
eukprot:6180043-Pleurochrysis_carterae.AAC.4